jgi:hypothetical protein
MSDPPTGDAGPPGELRSDERQVGLELYAALPFVTHDHPAGVTAPPPAQPSVT